MRQQDVENAFIRSGMSKEDARIAWEEICQTLVLGEDDTVPVAEFGRELRRQPAELRRPWSQLVRVLQFKPIVLPIRRAIYSG